MYTIVFGFQGYYLSQCLHTAVVFNDVHLAYVRLSLKTARVGDVA